MPADRLQTQRFEMKYLVNEGMAAKVRSFVACHLKPDEFAASLPGSAYPVHSLYLDSADLATYQAVQNGEKNRFKLRIRYYTESDEAVYFEIKRRTNDVISKMRAKVKRECVQALLHGRRPRVTDLTNPDGKNFAALQEFCRLMHTLRATPKSHVAYQREAWMSPAGNSMRVTFDRAVNCEPEFGCVLRTGLGDAVAPFENKIVLELKFVDRLPNWCFEMIRALGLVRGGAPKYAQGVFRMGEHRVSSRGVEFKTEPANHVGEKRTTPSPVRPAVAAWTKPQTI